MDWHISQPLSSCMHVCAETPPHIYLFTVKCTKQWKNLKPNFLVRTKIPSMDRNNPSIVQHYSLLFSTFNNSYKLLYPIVLINIKIDTIHSLFARRLEVDTFLGSFDDVSLDCILTAVACCTWVATAYCLIVLTNLLYVISWFLCSPVGVGLFPTNAIADLFFIEQYTSRQWILFTVCRKEKKKTQLIVSTAPAKLFCWL